MDIEKLNELKKLYDEYSDEDIKSGLEEGKDSYEPEAYELLCIEARKRAIEIPESKLSSEQTQALTYRERKIVFCTTNVIEANLVKSILESSGIDVYVQDENLPRLNPFLSQAIGGIKLTVPENQEKDALDVLTEYREKDNKDPNWGKGSPFQ